MWNYLEGWEGKPSWQKSMGKSFLKEEGVKVTIRDVVAIRPHCLLALLLIQMLLARGEK